MGEVPPIEEISGRPGLEPIRWIAWLCHDLFHLQIRHF